MRVLLFTGKGGVGKTTLAAATAARLAAGGHKALVVSTDPAHSLGDALGAPLTSAPAEVEGANGLYAAQIDARGLVDGAWQELRGHLHTVLAGAGVDELDAEELTVLPGVEELLALAEVERAARLGPWETVVVDCGPTAETLRLLALPEAFAGYLERLFPTHRRVVRGLLAGVAGSATVEKWDAAAEALGRLAVRLEALRDLLVSPEHTSVRLVLTPERVVAAETRRTLTALALQGIRVDGLVANRVLPDLGAGGRGAAAQWLRTRRGEQDTVLAELHEATDVPVRIVEHRAAEPVGVPALLELAAELYGEGDPLAGADRPPLVSVSGGGRGLDARYELHLALPLLAESAVDLARVDDDLVVTVDGRRKLVALPAALRRCEVTGAAAGTEGLTVRFRPDPRLWMR
ncbi:TRC40/GET3/ArsA family transport-energizing ATPase [Crossiella sp. CA-258035]|uniref:ArsA family ATPase n=1 Tax=Crossiella sp. CA-258035 TaxID=2981138 RepID=UPI0024BCE100|nr:ArsA family ATPase [Crossiella sp. CA-258035]WHT21256.1 TRC40/GET3/ArsA family transport-energizing ATPase [Crossiella sp. CA-258035]